MSRGHCLPILMSIVLLLWVLHGCSLLPQEKIEPFQTFQDSLSIGGLGPKMVAIPAGSFIMGPSPDEPLQLDKEKPRHKVTINKAFAISQYEITFAESRSYPKTSFSSMSEHPR